MSGHTPGPWRWTEYGSLLAENSTSVVRAASDGYGGSEVVVECVADEKLIAAAPDLYEALSGLVGLCALLLANDLPANVCDALENNPRMTAAHAALQKAEGRAQREQEASQVRG